MLTEVSQIVTLKLLQSLKMCNIVYESESFPDLKTISRMRDHGQRVVIRKGSNFENLNSPAPVAVDAKPSIRC